MAHQVLSFIEDYYHVVLAAGLFFLAFTLVIAICRTLFYEKATGDFLYSYDTSRGETKDLRHQENVFIETSADGIWAEIKKPWCLR